MEEQIRQWLSRYLKQEISISDFQRWFVSTTWSADDPEERSLREIIDAVDLRLAEYSSHFWSESDLRDQLRLILENQSIEITLNFRIPIRALFAAASRPSQVFLSGTLHSVGLRP